MSQSFLNSKLFSITFLFSFLIHSTKALCADGDSIKPLPRIDKEFLIIGNLVHQKDSSTMDSTYIRSVIEEVNEIYKPIGVSFKICQFRNIYNFQYDTIPEGRYDDDLMAQYGIGHGINMFFVSDFPKRPKLCGFASIGGINVPNTFVFIKKGDCANVTTIAHELGHYFGLYHTFEGSGTELADGSNCLTAGDGVCDTPADPFFEDADVKKYVDSDCIFINTRKDAKGNYYNPDVSNIMGYYSNCRCLKFTNGQYEKMVNYYFQNPTSW